AGRMPFSGSMMAALHMLASRDPLPIRDFNPAVPDELAELVLQLMAKEPANRPASAEEVADRLQAIERRLAASKADGASRTAVLPPSQPSSTRRPGPAMACNASSWRRSGVAAAVTLAALLPLGWFFGGTVVHIATNKGELVIESDDPNLE